MNKSEHTCNGTHQKEHNRIIRLLHLKLKQLPLKQFPTKGIRIVDHNLQNWDLRVKTRGKFHALLMDGLEAPLEIH